MSKLDMMVGYEMNFYEKKFEENIKKLSYYMHRCFNETIGEKVAGIAIEENLLYAWSYYFVTIADEDPKMVDRIMMGLINHFNTLLEDENVRINGKEGAKLMIDPSFCRVWFGTSLNVMLVKKYGEEDYKEVFNYIKDNYLQKECKIRSLKVS